MSHEEPTAAGAAIVGLFGAVSEPVFFYLYNYHARRFFPVEDKEK
jgi:hypothetical protein